MVLYRRGRTPTGSRNDNAAGDGAKKNLLGTNMTTGKLETILCRSNLGHYEYYTACYSLPNRFAGQISFGCLRIFPYPSWLSRLTKSIS